MTPKRVLITGGAGFLGSNLCKRLVAEGHEVTSLDDDSRGNRPKLDAVSYIKGDVTYDHDVNVACDDIDTVWHLAAINGTRHFYERPDDVLNVQIEGTLNVLKACKSHDIKDLVLFSSSEVYATPPIIPTPETVPLRIPDVTNPRYSYAGGKIAAEIMCWHSSIERVTVARPHNVFGPAMGYEHVIPELTMKLAQAAAGEPVPLASPWSTRAFCYVSDFIDGAVTAWERAGGKRDIFHIGTEKETQIFDLASMICRVLGRDEPPWQMAEAPDGSPGRRCPDTSRLRALGWGSRVKLEDGLAETVRWYLAERERWPVSASSGSLASAASRP